MDHLIFLNNQHIELHHVKYVTLLVLVQLSK